MTDTPAAPVSLLLYALAGALLALLYLGALWASLRWMPAGRRAAPWMLASGVARLALVVGGFWLLSGGGGPGLASAFVGFVVARTLGVGVVRAGIGDGSAGAAAGRSEP